MGSRPDTWMPLYVGDYLADTTHLTAEQHGAYLLLIMAYWRRGKPLPEDHKELCRIARVAPQRWCHTWGVLKCLFENREGQLRHKRVDIELQRSQQRSASARMAAASRWQCADDASNSHSHTAARAAAAALPAEASHAAVQHDLDAIITATGADLARWVGNLAPAHAWLSAGYDLHADILPTIRSIAARSGYTADKPLGYFTKAIVAANAQRCGLRPAAIRHPLAPRKTPEERNYERAVDLWAANGCDPANKPIAPSNGSVRTSA